MSERAALFARAQREVFDLLVLGGGVTGAGIARDAALRGLRVCLVEKSDLAAGTSSASSKLIHGGLRYLEQLEFGLVREGVRERGLLMKNAPHLARPLPFLFPVYRDSRVGMMGIRAGMWLYDLLALWGNYRSHRMLPSRRVRRIEPSLNSSGLRGAALYYDCMTDDARLTLETALDAEALGALVLTYAEAVSFLSDKASHTTGVAVRDRLDGAGIAGVGEPSAPVEVRAKVTAVAAGPWSDGLLRERVGQPLLRPTKGTHVVLPRERLPVSHAIALTHPVDKRVMFAIPWGKRTIVGTTDTDASEPPDDIEASRQDVDYLLEAANYHFPQLHATRADVVSTWSGLRPLMGDPASAVPSDVSREHAIVNLDPGLVAIAGGKLTTYRAMAQQVVDRVLSKLGYKVASEPCRTKSTPLLGAREPERLRDLPAYAQELAREHGLDEEIALHLAQSYGLRAPEVLEAGQEVGVRPGRLLPELPYLVDEVVFAVTRDRAQRLDDVLRRRTLIFLQARCQGLSVCEEAARIMGDLLQWDEERVRIEVERYRGMVAASRRWQEPAGDAE